MPSIFSFVVDLVKACESWFREVEKSPVAIVAIVEYAEAFLQSVQEEREGAGDDEAGGDYMDRDICEAPCGRFCGLTSFEAVARRTYVVAFRLGELQLLPLN